MSNVVALKQEQEEEETKIVTLELIKGGKEPPIGGADWLTNLEVGMLFLVQSKTNPMDFNLHTFWLEDKKFGGKVCVLRTEKLPEELLVNPVRFCNSWLLYHEIGIVERRKPEHDDGHRDEQLSGDPSGPVE